MEKINAKRNQERTRYFKLDRRPDPIFRRYIMEFAFVYIVIAIGLNVSILWAGIVPTIVCAILLLIGAPIIPAISTPFLNRRSFKVWLSTFEEGWTPKNNARSEGSRRTRSETSR